MPEERLRFNLDPDNSRSDETLTDALAKGGLWSHFVESDKRVVGGIAISGFNENPFLEKKVSLLQELSVGQCQLFAICRALAKASALRALGVTPVVVFDEVISSLDVATGSTIYRIVDEEFTQKVHTVIIIAHWLGNLHTKVGRDAVAFMADGRLQEVRRDLVPSTFHQFPQTE